MYDLISRQDAINIMMALQAEDDEAYGCHIPEGFDGERAKEALEHLPSAQQWIPIKMRSMDAEGGRMSELKPCPFCGGKINITYNSSDKTFSIWHTNIRCGVAEPIKIDSAVTFDEAAKIWNRRAKNG